ncbi:MAG TPA: prepilin-type N-terminal cleavage/methylation domain-containing protein [Alphaproteobacteria bacterium]|nr:prepilin-type N-terminal cleavage/methylation domain-containing protein [Alphaproteobacteria bacterium]
MVPTAIHRKRARAGFTLIELLVVIAVIVVVAALLFPALMRSREQAQSTGCRNRLHQIGLALQMYVQDNGWYPPLAQRGTDLLCFDRLLPYDPLSWTNAGWNCPTYMANRGIVSRDLVDNESQGISYAYNWLGYGGGWLGCPESVHQYLGLGFIPTRPMTEELKVRSPSDMYAVPDARPEILSNGIAGVIKMIPWSDSNINEASPPHAQGYNILFCDGHVTLVTRRDYLFPPRTAHNWNFDNQPHRELWAPPYLWEVQN